MVLVCESMMSVCLCECVCVGERERVRKKDLLKASFSCGVLQLGSGVYVFVCVCHRDLESNKQTTVNH